MESSSGFPSGRWAPVVELTPDEASALGEELRGSPADLGHHYGLALGAVLDVLQCPVCCCSPGRRLGVWG